MKSIELLPTQENIFNTLYQDPFHRNQEIAAFLNLLTTIEGHFVISIDGEWGTGKTFFVKQCEMILTAINNKEKLPSEYFDKVLHVSFLEKDSLLEKLKGQNCIYFDAWSNDDYEQPILALLNTLVKNVPLPAKIDKSNVVDTFKKIGEEIRIPKIGISVTSILHALDNPSSEESNKQNDLHHYIEKIIKYYVSQGQRLIIFVDELDRCKPSFAVKLLEQIKHYFLLDNVTFVFSTNIEELTQTINKFYGDKFKGDKYLHRFFDLTLPIPKINSKIYFEYLINSDPTYVYQKNRDCQIVCVNRSFS